MKKEKEGPADRPPVWHQLVPVRGDTWQVWRGVTLVGSSPTLDGARELADKEAERV